MFFEALKTLKTAILLRTFVFFKLPDSKIAISPRTFQFFGVSEHVFLGMPLLKPMILYVETCFFQNVLDHIAVFVSQDRRRWSHQFQKTCKNTSFGNIFVKKCWMPLLKLLFLVLKPSILTHALDRINIFWKICILSRAFDELWALVLRGVRVHRMPLDDMHVFQKMLIWSRAFVKIKGFQTKKINFSKGIRHFLTNMLPKPVFLQVFWNWGLHRRRPWDTKTAISLGTF